MKRYSYSADLGSIKLINKNGCSILLSNRYGDGMFNFYILDTEEEFESKELEDKPFRQESLWIDSEGWKVMTYDSAKNYNEDGVELDSDYITIYRLGTTFAFVLNKDLINK